MLETMRRRLSEVDRRLLDVVGPLTDDQVRAPSRLPEWSRGHVLAHIAGVGNAAARQLEVAVADGEPLPYYDGGMAGRSAAIEAGAPASAAEHVAAIRAATARMAVVTADVTPDILDRVTGARGRSVQGVLELWWREVGVHLVDLDLGVDLSSWDREFRDHLAAYLTARVPRGMALDLRATDADERRLLGDGPDVVVLSGTATALIGWLAGRTHDGVTALRSGRPADLPELDPWP